jgi:hypothetical protein
MAVKYNFAIQVLVNLIPLIGFWFFGWSMFAIIYIYWTEGLIVALFECARIAIASGKDREMHGPDAFPVRLFSAFKFLLLKFGVLLFYWIFIFAFVANPQGEENKVLLHHNYMILFFADKSFNNALLIYFLSQFVFFLSTFIANNDYKTRPNSDYKLFFDGRTIVLHVVIVLGTFGYQYFKKFESFDSRLPALSYVLLLVVIKTIADIIGQRYRHIGVIGAAGRPGGQI